MSFPLRFVPMQHVAKLTKVTAAGDCRQRQLLSQSVFKTLAKWGGLVSEATSGSWPDRDLARARGRRLPLIVS